MQDEKETLRKLTLFSLTWPIFIELLLHMLMGNADTLMLSQYSDHSVAAVGVSNQVLSLIIVMFGFITTGTAILISQNIGAKQHRTAGEVSVISIGANLIFGLLLSVLMVLLGVPILKLMNLPAELMVEASFYLKLVGAFSFTQAVLMTIGAVLRSYGYTRDAMFITVGMNILHVIGNYLFIFGPFGLPVLGVQGVAISTVVSKMIALLVAVYMLKKRLPELPYKKLFSFQKLHLKNLLKIGVPSAGEHLAYITSQMAITYFVAKLGTEALTVRVYVENIMMFIYLCGLAIGEGTQILIGRMIGAKDFDAAYKRCMRSLWISLAITIGVSLVFSLFSKQLLSIFTEDASIIAAGSVLVWITLLLEPGRVFNLVIISALRAAGDVKFPVYLGILSMWGVSVTLSYFFGITMGLGLIGVWLALSADEWLRGLLMLWRWRSRVWVKKSFVKEQVEVV